MLRWMDHVQAYPDTTNMGEGAWASVGGTYVISTANPPVDHTQTVRGGSNSPGFDESRRILGATLSSAGFGYRFFPPSLPTAELCGAGGSPIMMFRDPSNNTSMAVVLGTDGSLLANVGVPTSNVTVQRSEPGLIIPGAYNHLETYCDPSSSGSLEARVNGVTALNFVGNCQGASNGTVGQVAFGNHGGPFDYVDFFAWDTNAGPGPSWFVGNCVVLMSALTSDISTTMTAVGGGPPDYPLLKDNSDATYMDAGTVGEYYQAGYGSLPSDVTGVIAAQVNFRAFKSNAGDCDVTPGMVSGGDLDQSTACVISIAPAWYFGVFADDPGSSGSPFSVAAYNAGNLRLDRTL